MQKKTPLHFSELGKKMALPALTIRETHGKKSTAKLPLLDRLRIFHLSKKF